MPGGCWAWLLLPQSPGEGRRRTMAWQVGSLLQGLGTGGVQGGGQQACTLGLEAWGGGGELGRGCNLAKLGGGTVGVIGRGQGAARTFSASVSLPSRLCKSLKGMAAGGSSLAVAEAWLTRSLCPTGDGHAALHGPGHGGHHQFRPAVPEGQ